MEEPDQHAESKTDKDNSSIPSSVDAELNTTVLRLSQKCSLDNKMACEEWKRVQIVEQHVFTSFVIIYVIAHAVFIFWLYFDASRRRREMRQKDKEYRVSPVISYLLANNLNPEFITAVLRSLRPSGQ
ncbi:uncharacterized protein DEA37_0008344 [Paragonimus westermani]|uniref:Uncharacterized protein n=1 Tax=Paragonimus westermani TaxID=34504 RepID=A0A5J4N5M8_9TREM|nr:uncharacterized protein DEA37_0008344 [Paragonimus westermani]